MRIDIIVPFEFYLYLSGLIKTKVKYVEDKGNTVMVLEDKNHLFYIFNGGKNGKSNVSN